MTSPWHQRDWDVIVVGGGPAGSTAAAYLAMQGHDVCLLDREKGARHRVGESMLPSMMPILEDFGLIETVEALGFRRKSGGTFIWGKSREPWDVLFNISRFLPYTYAYHVNREIFDEVLLKHAERRGVEVRRPASVTGPILEGPAGEERVVGVTAKVGKSGRTRQVRARFVIDASGPSSAVGRHLTHREYDDKMRQVAFYSYWTDVDGPTGVRLEHTIIESNPWGWFWYIPMNGEHLGEASVGLVSGQEFAQEYRQMGHQAFYERALAACPYMQELLGPRARRILDIRAITDWAYTCNETTGPGWYLAGDAAAFLDPLLSSGGTMAMLAGYSASVCIHTSLTNASMESEARRFYQDNYRRMYEVTRDFLHYFYAGNQTAHTDDLFWKARSVLKFSENLGACQAFCFLVNALPGNPHPAMRKQIHMYKQFMNQLDHPLDELQADEAFQDRIAGLAARTSGEPASTTPISASDVLVLNGHLERSFTIDGDTHTLRSIRGLGFDAERPILSSSSSWLLGKNVHPLDDASWALVQCIDGNTPWHEVKNRFASATQQSLAACGEEADRLVDALQRERLVLVRDAQTTTHAQP